MVNKKDKQKSWALWALFSKSSFSPKSSWLLTQFQQAKKEVASWSLCKQRWMKVAIRRGKED